VLGKHSQGTADPNVSISSFVARLPSPRQSGTHRNCKHGPGPVSTTEAPPSNKENNVNGFLILHYLVSHCCNTTDVDISNARQRLETTLWNDRDTIETYTQRFMKLLSIVQESIAARSDVQHTTSTEDYVTFLYLRLLITSLPKQHDLRTAIQTLCAKCQADMASLNTLDTNASSIQHNLFQLQLTEDAHIDATDSHGHHWSHRPYHKQKPPHNHPFKQRANAVQHSKRYRNIKCWGCGRDHHLLDCPTTSC
jgi:hypothetical protein